MKKHKWTKGFKLLEQLFEVGCYLRFQDEEWIVFRKDGEGVFSADSIEGIVKKLGKLPDKGIVYLNAL